MTKRLVISVRGFAFVLAAAIVLMFATVTPAMAQTGDRAADGQAAGLQAAQSQAVSVQDTTSPLIVGSADSVIYVRTEGQKVYQGTGVTRTYNISGFSSVYWYADDWKMQITSTSGTGSVRYKAAAYDSEYSITTVKPGAVTVNCTETWTTTEEEYNSETQEYEEVETPHVATHSFVINAVSLANKSGVLTGVVSEGGSSKTLKVKLQGLPADADVVKVSDSNKNGGSWINRVEAGKVYLYVYGKGTHKIKLSACGKTISCKVVLRELKLKKTAAVKDTGSLVTFPGRRTTVKVSLTGVKKPKVKWTSTDTNIAKVSKKGVVRAKNNGRCYVKAKVDGATIKVLVEVTSKDAYKAVRNGFADMKKTLTYSQPNRMSAECRDCSSFVSRCYWDESLGRTITIIGEPYAAQWAYTAAGQAQWLENHGKRVAWKACSAKKLLPGDTVYYETDYAGKDASQWRYIDHAAMYVGNGYILNTGGHGGKGTIGLGSYWAKDSSVKFIGRPCP